MEANTARQAQPVMQFSCKKRLMEQEQKVQSKHFPNALFHISAYLIRV
jgi:hypothetical protein